MQLCLVGHCSNSWRASVVREEPLKVCKGGLDGDGDGIQTTPSASR